MSMIQINTLQVLRAGGHLPDPLPYDAMIDAQIEEVFRCFVKPELRPCSRPWALAASTSRDCPEGRCVNPGHAIETAWFILAEGKQQERRALIERALPILDWSLRAGVGSRSTAASCTSWTSRGSSPCSTSGT